MPLTVKTNLSSQVAHRHAQRAQNEVANSVARLASGLRINSAGDDAAGLAIVDRFTAQIRGTLQAARSTNDGISLGQTAEGALRSVGENLQRMRELAVQAASSTLSASDRTALRHEVSQLSDEIDRVATQTRFNGHTLLNGSFGAQAFQVGANAGETITFAGIDSMRAAGLGRYLGATLERQPVGVPSVVLADRRALTMTVGITTYGLGTIDIDAKEIARAINSAGVEGLSAAANPTVIAGDNLSLATATAPSGTAIYTLNSYFAIPIPGVGGAGGLAANRAAAVAAINAQTAQHGVVATDVGTGVTLVAQDGRNITAAYDANTFTGGWSENFGLPLPAIVGSTVDVTYVAPPGVAGSLAFQQDSVAGSNLGFTNATALGMTGSSVDSVDISTTAGASAALTTLDKAIATVGEARARLGAAGQRFQRALASAGDAIGHLSASRSRIQDADFATETANLSRAQVVQEAGTAMVAQANQLPQQVVELLRWGR